MKTWQRITRRILAVGTLSVLLFPFVATFAATVTNLTDNVTTLEISEAADHSFAFTTPTGAALGSTITLSFEADFNTASITEDDVDVSDDAVDLTTAANCAGSEQASVAMASDVLTITICAGDGGAIGAGSVVRIEIGANATSSGTGANQIVNPPSPGTYYVNLNGTFGDSGSVPLPIGGDDSIGVSATVAGGGGGGGGPGGGGGGDVTPPVISNVQAINITEHEADITWSTDDAATSVVEYGLTTSYEVGTITDLGQVTNHSVHLSDLIEGMLYHYRVRSTNTAALESISGDFTFTTLDFTAPVISNIQSVNTTTTSTTITWTTDEPATSVVNYGETISYGTTLSDGSLVMSHSVVVTGLTAGTLYHFRVQSADASGNNAISSDQTFTTVADPPPGNVSNLSVTPGDGQTQLSWSNPADADLVAIRILACTDTFPSGPTDTDGCSVVFESLATTFTHTGLVNGTTYFYGVFPRDSAGQFASGALGQGTPSAPEEEPPPAEEPPPEEPPPEEPPVPPPGPTPPPPTGGGAFCGNSVCDAGESSESCSADCPVSPVPTPGPVCGNNVCEEGETNASCTADCPLSLPPTDLLREDLEFYAAGGTIQLTFANSRVAFVNGSQVRSQLLARNLTKPVERVVLSFAGQSFLMAPNFSTAVVQGLQIAAIGDDAYVADVVAPETPQIYPATVTITYEDGSAQSINLNLDVQGHGVIRESSTDGTQPSAGATVTLLEASGPSAWDASPFNQQNPLTTGFSGQYAWYVPNGAYAVHASKSGFTNASRALLVTNNIVNASLTLASEEPVPIVSLIPELPAAVQNVVDNVLEGLQTIQDNPAVETAAELSVPTLATIAALSGISLAISFNLLPFLQYLFTAPILFFGRRKRRGYGVVYNAVSKMPIDLATVRLFRLEAQTNAPPRFVQSRVTDREGRYYFSVLPGRYVISVSKQGFAFPSAVLKDTRTDLDYLDIYHAEPIEVSDADAVIAANIPLDPAQAERTPARVLWKARLRTAQQVLAVTGVVISFIFAFLYPSWITISLAVLQVVVYATVRRLTKVKKPQHWGIVYDQATGKPLSNAIARIFDPSYNKLLETVVTDSRGRYSFVLGPSAYYAVFQKPGYKNVEVRPIDLTRERGPTEFGIKVQMPQQQVIAAPPVSGT